MLNPPLGKGLHPLGMMTRLDLLKQCLKDVLGITHNWNGGPDILAKLGRIDVDMNDLSVRCEGIQAACDPVIHSHTNGDQTIGMGNGHVGVVHAVHAGPAEIEGVGFWETGDPEQGSKDRNLSLLGECSQLRVRAGQDDPVSGDDQGLLRLLNHPRRLAYLLGVALHFRLEPGQVDLGRVFVNGGVGGHVLRNVYQDGTGASGPGDMKRLLDDPRQVLDVHHKVVVFGDGHRDPGRIGLLEGVFADHVGWNLTGNRNHRNRIHHRCGDARDQIRRAGPGSP